jgi:hypothetical protein
MMSFGPPGGNGTTSLIFLLGKSCAAANAGHSNANPISSGLKALTVVLPLIFMRLVPVRPASLLCGQHTSLPGADASRGGGCWIGLILGLCGKK